LVDCCGSERRLGVDALGVWGDRCVLPPPLTPWARIPHANTPSFPLVAGASNDPAQGHIKFWTDGSPVADETAQTKPDSNPMFFQTGIHRANHSDLTDTVYFDSFVEGTALEDVLAPASMGGGGSAPGGAANAGAAGGAASSN
jgi:hypothetical protein